MFVAPAKVKWASLPASASCTVTATSVAERSNNCVSVFSVGAGEFVRHVGVGVLKHPHGVACSALDELVVADTGNRRVVLFSEAGALLMAFGDGAFSCVALHNGAVVAVDRHERCIVFT